QRARKHEPVAHEPERVGPDNRPLAVRKAIDYPRDIKQRPHTKRERRYTTRIVAAVYKDKLRDSKNGPDNAHGKDNSVEHAQVRAARGEGLVPARPFAQPKMMRELHCYIIAEVKQVNKILYQEVRASFWPLMCVLFLMLLTVGFDVISPWPFKILIDNVLS